MSGATTAFPVGRPDEPGLSAGVVPGAGAGASATSADPWHDVEARMAGATAAFPVGVIPAAEDAGEKPMKLTSKKSEGEAASEPLTSEGQAERRARRVRRRRRGLIVLAVVLVVLATATVLGVRHFEQVARETVISRVGQAMPGLSDDALIDPGQDWILPQAWDGTLKQLDVTASSLQVNVSAAPGQPLTPVALNSMSLKIGSLQIASPHTAQTFKVSGTISWEQLSTLLAANLESKRDSFPLGIVPSVTLSQGQDGAVRASMDAAGTSLSANADASISPEGDLLVTLSKVEVEAGSLGGGLGISDGNEVLEYLGIPTTMTVLRDADLPAGLAMTSVTSDADGVTAVLEGQNLSLDALGSKS